MLRKIESYIVSCGGKKLPKLAYWNASDDCPTLNHSAFIIPTNNGNVYVEAYEKKENITWPDYKCVGDSYRDKFAVNIYNKNNNKIINVVEFVEISDENMQKFIGQFKTSYEV